MDVPPDLIRGTVVPVILSLLGERPMYGYELAKVVNARTNGVLAWREGTLYPTLHKLELDGLIRGEWRDSDPGEKGPGRRKYYLLTRTGLAEARRRRGQWEAFSGAINTLMKGV